MNMTYTEGIELAKSVNSSVSKLNDHSVEVILGTPFIHIADVAKIVKPEFISVAAQNCAAWDRGAYTGEISAEMIRSAGAKYVIIGHSERRKHFNEDEATLFEKVKLSLENQLKPIFCCGEVLEQRNAKKHFDVVKYQINESVFSLSEKEFSEIIVAYEPVWAIGTGVNATPEQAQEMHKFIRDLIKNRYGAPIAENTTILYGGSCKPSNARELFENPDVDGGLIGGASLKTEDFLGIIKAF